jgi:phospholipid/cholesterol/gamma-HCH transport system substrate-binding protein
MESLTENMSNISSNNKEEISTILNNLSDGSKAFSESAKKINNILDRVENGEGSLGRLVNSNDLADNMNGFIDDLRLLLEDFSENTEEYLKKYIRANKKVKKEK